MDNIMQRLITHSGLAFEAVLIHLLVDRQIQDPNTLNKAIVHKCIFDFLRDGDRALAIQLAMASVDWTIIWCMLLAKRREAAREAAEEALDDHGDYHDSDTDTDHDGLYHASDTDTQFMAEEDRITNSWLPKNKKARAQY